MPKSIGVLFVASEAEPFIKTGKIGDLAGSLPKSVKALGHDVRVMLPGYGFLNSRRFQIHNLLRMKDIVVPVANDLEKAYIKSSYLTSENQKVLVYFLSNDRYFNREGLYFHPETKKYFADNDERFIFFCRGILETLKRLRWQPNIIHCNDWQCGLIPVYLKTLYKNDPFFKNVKTVFTAYSLASHASFPRNSYAKSGLPAGLFPENDSGMDRLNFLKAGLTYADCVTTFGSKAEKSIRIAPDTELEKILHLRKNNIISMNFQNGNGHNHIAQKLVDIYHDLSKSI